MFHCPKCHYAAHARTSRYFSDTTKERYHQCTNINCSCTFVTTETVERFIVSPGKSYRLHRTRHHQVSNKFTGCEPKGNPANAGFFIDVVNVWTLEEINPFISVYYVQKISLRKGDYAG